MKWEYTIIVTFDVSNIDGSKEFEELYNAAMTEMNRLGSEDWELVSVDNGIAYFERPVKETTVSNVFRDGVPVKQANDD